MRNNSEKSKQKGFWPFTTLRRQYTHSSVWLPSCRKARSALRSHCHVSAAPSPLPTTSCPPCGAQDTAYNWKEQGAAACTVTPSMQACSHHAWLAIDRTPTPLTSKCWSSTGMQMPAQSPKKPQQLWAARLYTMPTTPRAPCWQKQQPPPPPLPPSTHRAPCHCERRAPHPTAGRCRPAPPTQAVPAASGGNTR